MNLCYKNRDVAKLSLIGHILVTLKGV